MNVGRIEQLTNQTLPKHNSKVPMPKVISYEERKQKQVEFLAKALCWESCKNWDNLTPGEQTIWRSKALDILDYMEDLKSFERKVSL